MQSNVPPPVVSAPPPPPPGWPMMPPPKRGLSTTAIVVIVVVVVVAVVLALFLAAFFFVMMTPVLPPGPTRPVLTFSSPDLVTNGFEVFVAGASQALPGQTYRVALSVNGTTQGTARTLAASMAFGEYTITWTDLGGEGRLTGGDLFRVTRAGGLPANSDFSVSILWTDGSSIGSFTYST